MIVKKMIVKKMIVSKMIVIIMTNINIAIMVICIMRDFPVSSVCLYSGLRFSQDLTSGKSCVVLS